jgi:hypothetical protein
MEKSQMRPLWGSRSLAAIFGYFGYEAKALTFAIMAFPSPTWDIGLMFADRWARAI